MIDLGGTGPAAQVEDATPGSTPADSGGSPEPLPSMKSAGFAPDHRRLLWPASALLALLFCLCGGALLLREPASPPPRVSHPRVTHRPRSTAPTWTAVPQGAAIEARVLRLDTHYGGITLLVGGEQYLYHLSPSTVFPSACLQRADLRPGIAVIAVVPWYLSGDVYLSAVEPAQQCGAPLAVRTVVPAALDSPAKR